MNRKKRGSHYVAVHALRLSGLAHGWARFLVGRALPGMTVEEKHDLRTREFREFLYGHRSKFNTGFPVRDIFFIPSPSQHNARMQRQMGAFIYDSLDYNELGYRDLEDLIGNIKEPREVSPEDERPGEPTLVKILVNRRAARDVFERLELMGISLPVRDTLAHRN